MFKKTHTKKGSKIISSLLSAPFLIISEKKPRRRKSSREIFECSEEDIKFLKSHKRQIILIFMILFIVGIMIFGVEFIIYLLIFVLVVFFVILNNS